MLADAPGADEAETGDEGDGREGVEEGVECRKEEQMGARNIGGRMIIDEPAEEEAGDSANGDNGDVLEQVSLILDAKGIQLYSLIVHASLSIRRDLVKTAFTVPSG